MVPEALEGLLKGSCICMLLSVPSMGLLYKIKYEKIPSGGHSEVSPVVTERSLRLSKGRLYLHTAKLSTVALYFSFKKKLPLSDIQKRKFMRKNP